MSEEVVLRKIDKVNPGDLFDLLKRSYSGLLKTDTGNKDKYLKSWRNFDENAFNNPAIGKCIFVSWLDNKPIGFASYDPRNFPEYGVVGQNCILPEYQGKGYGKRQIEELLRIFKENNCTKAVVTTAEAEFFIPAQRMYKSLGFTETGRQFDKQWGYNIIEYQKYL